MKKCILDVYKRQVINTPVTLEFLGLNEHAFVTENDLEQSILDNLQHFLLEMGHGFCFETRQKRILIDEDYFFTDLVFLSLIHILNRDKTSKQWEKLRRSLRQSEEEPRKNRGLRI